MSGRSKESLLSSCNARRGENSGIGNEPMSYAELEPRIKRIAAGARCKTFRWSSAVVRSQILKLL